jgi:hypothetical protein
VLKISIFHTDQLLKKIEKWDNHKPASSSAGLG